MPLVCSCSPLEALRTVATVIWSSSVLPVSCVEPQDSMQSPDLQFLLSYFQISTGTTLSGGPGGFMRQGEQSTMSQHEKSCAIINLKTSEKTANLLLPLHDCRPICIQLQGALPPDLLTRGSAPGLNLGLCPYTLVIGSHCHDHNDDPTYSNSTN